MITTRSSRRDSANGLGRPSSAAGARSLRSRRPMRNRASFGAFVEAIAWSVSSGSVIVLNGA